MKFRVIPDALVCASLLLAAAPALAGDVSEIPITTSSDVARVDFLAGQAALDRGDGSEANALFRAAVAKDPEFAYAWYNLGNVAFSTEEFAQATQRAKAVADEASEGEQLLIDMNLRFLDNDFEAQLALAEQLVEKYPRSPRAWVALAGVQNGLNAYENARSSFEQALKLDEAFVPAVTGLANSYLFNAPKDFDKAGRAFERAIALQRGEDAWYVGLGDVYRAVGRLDDARLQYARATMLDPNNGIAFVKKGHVNSFLGNYEEARSDYDHGITVAPAANKPFLASYREFTWVHAGEPATAVARLHQLVSDVDETEVPPEQRNGAKLFALTNAATISLHTGLYDEAAGLLSERSRILREDARKVGTEEFERVQESNIAYFDGLLAARRGDYAKAREHAQHYSALVEAIDNPRKMENYHDLMGLIHLKQAQYARAVQHYRQANLTTMYTKYHLALALDGAGEHQEARELFSEVANWNFNSVGYALVRRDALSRSS